MLQEGNFEWLKLQKLKVIEDLNSPPDSHLEKLVGNRDGFYSIRINEQWRIVFKFENECAENGRITDYY